MATQMTSARRGVPTDEMRRVAKDEDVTLDWLLPKIASGSIIIPSNNVRPQKIHNVGIGKGMKTKVNVNIGSSTLNVNVDEEIEKEAGLSLGEIFELRGESHYRELEASVLTRCLSQETPLVIATGGSIVTSPNTWMSLRTSAQTVWLRASPHAHLARVRAQGDLRPMRGRPDALGELKAILKERESLYGMCEQHIDTDTLNALETVAQLVATQ